MTSSYATDKLRSKKTNKRTYLDNRHKNGNLDHNHKIQSPTLLPKQKYKFKPN